MTVEKFHLEKIGVVGSLVATLCCLGLAPLIAVLSAVGAGFLIHDAVLLPLLIVFLIVGAVGLFVSYRRHGSREALFVHGVSAVVILVFTFVVYVQPLVWLGIAGLLLAPFLDWRCKKACVPA